MTFNVTSAEQAAEKLLYEWPLDKGAKLFAARRAVLKALEHAGDSKRAMAARKAFEATAVETDVLMPPEPVKPAVSEMINLRPWRGKRKRKRAMR